MSQYDIMNLSTRAIVISMLKFFTTGFQILVLLDTPQLQEEQLHRSKLVQELASFGTTFKPATIANDILTGVERGSFVISHGFDGFILKTVTAGTGPASSLLEVVIQVCSFISV